MQTSSLLTVLLGLAVASGQTIAVAEDQSRDRDSSSIVDCSRDQTCDQSGHRLLIRRDHDDDRDRNRGRDHDRDDDDDRNDRDDRDHDRDDDDDQDDRDDRDDDDDDDDRDDD